VSGKSTPKWDIRTIRAAVARVHLVRTMAPEPQRPIRSQAARDAHTAYTAGWDECAEVVDQLLRAMVGVRS
jgi:hypothetical protein